MRVHFDIDAWCIITACGVSAFTVDTQVILQRGSGFLRDCLCGESVPKLGGLPKPWVKEVFMLSILFKTQRFFVLDKYIRKVKLHPMRSSLFYGICRI